MFTFQAVDDPRVNDSPLTYDCNNCPAMTRAIRNCRVWPPPEVESLHALAPDRVPAGVTRDEMQAIIARTTDTPGAWTAGAQFNTVSAVQAALSQGDMTVDAERCPVLQISPTSRRFLRLYQRVQTFGSGMGGVAPPRANILDEDVRVIHAFQLIAGESERLRQDRRTVQGA